MSTMTCVSEGNTSVSVDERLLMALRETGPQTLEKLALLPGLSWPQVFLAIDRLSRSGAVSLQRTRRFEYEVSINRMAA